MAVFDVSFMNKATRKPASDYGIIVDQLDILESSLEADGKLSPGDYALLNQKAQQIYAHPGLSADNRSNIEVKMARYKSLGQKTGVKTQEDIGRINNSTEDDYRKIAYRFGNDPEKFLQGKAAAQNAQLSALADAVDRLDQSGDDASGALNEYNTAAGNYQDTIKALDYVQTKGHSSKTPGSDYVAYIKTNNSGEIVDVDVAREGAKTGSLETNGLYGGLKIYGAQNRKENGSVVFLLGQKRFSAADIVTPGPDGSMKAPKLVDESSQRALGRAFSAATGNTYSPIDTSTLKVQTSIPTGGYARGNDKGFLYRKESDGTYTKLINTSPEKLGITDGQIQKIPRSMEQGIIPSVKRTVDGSIPVTPPSFPIANFATPSSVPPQAPTSQPSALGAGRARTGAPTTSAPQTTQGIAGRTIDAAKGFFSRYFGK